MRWYPNSYSTCEDLVLILGDIDFDLSVGGEWDDFNVVHIRKSTSEVVTEFQQKYYSDPKYGGNDELDLGIHSLKSIHLIFH